MSQPNLEANFLQAIASEPEEDAHRLAYADWLEERSDPRGEYIRLACELQNVTSREESDAIWERMKVLRDTHSRKWFGHVLPYVDDFQTRRGFIETAYLSRRQLTRWEEMLNKIPTLRQVVVRKAGRHVQYLTDSPRTKQIERIDVGRIPSEDIQRIANSKHLKNLRLLKINSLPVDDLITLLESERLSIGRVLLLWYGNQLSLTMLPNKLTLWIENFSIRWLENDLPRLWNCPGWEQVESLWMSYRRSVCSGHRDSAVEQVGHCPHLTRVRELQLNSNGTTDEEVRVLTESRSLNKLKVLMLDDNHITDQGVDRIVSRWPRLKELSLSSNDISSTGAATIAKKSKGLEELSLSSNRVFLDGMSALANAPSLKSLKNLHLRGNPGGGLATGIITSSPYLAQDALEFDHEGNIDDNRILEEIQGHPLAAEIKSLRLYGYGITDRALEFIRDNSTLTNVESLQMDFCNLSREGLDALADWPGLASLKRFSMVTSVNYRKASGKAFERLLLSEHWGDVEEFRLSAGYRFKDDGLKALAKAKFRSTLREISAWGEKITSSAIEDLAEGGSFDSLQNLVLYGNKEIGSKGAVALATAEKWKSLTSLDLRGCEIGNEGAQALGESQSFPKLQELILGDNGITHKGARALIESSLFRRLRVLNLEDNALTKATLQAMADVGDAPKLKELTLSSCGIGDAGLQALLESSVLRGVTSLSLNENKIRASGAEALANSESLARVESLDLSSTNIGDRGLIAIAQSTTLKKLKRLDVRDVKITKACIDALLASKLLRRVDMFCLTYNGPEWEQLKEKFGDRIST